MKNNAELYENLDNLLIKLEDQNSLALIKQFLQVPISRIQIGIGTQETVLVNGVKINVTSDPLQISIVTDQGEIKLASISSAADQILNYLKSPESIDSSWQYKDCEIFQIGQEGLDRRIYELRKGTAKPIRLTIVASETEDFEAIKAKVNTMIDSIY
jgi:hypothetical protein